MACGRGLPSGRGLTEQGCSRAGPQEGCLQLSDPAIEACPLISAPPPLGCATTGRRGAVSFASPSCSLTVSFLPSEAPPPPTPTRTRSPRPTFSSTVLCPHPLKHSVVFALVATPSCGRGNCTQFYTAGLEPSAHQLRAPWWLTWALAGPRLLGKGGWWLEPLGMGQGLHAPALVPSALLSSVASGNQESQQQAP